jgi:hypothetical protein
VSNPGHLYRIVASQAIRDEIIRLARLARDGNQLDLFLHAARWIEEELHRAPHELGESRSRLPAMGFELRITFAGPLQVEYAIHEPSKTVYYRRIRWNNRRS